MFEDIFSTALRQSAPLLIVAALAFAALLVLKTLLGGSSSRAVTFPYVRRPRLFTETEARFLRVLREAAPDAHVFGKVRLEDVIVAKSGLSQSERQSARNRIKSRHLDFVLVDLASTRVICAVELDDSSHSSPQARRSDAFKDAALAAASLPLLRVPARGSYDVEELRALIRSAVNPPAVTPTTAAWVEGA